MKILSLRLVTTVAACAFSLSPLRAQGTLADYQRAHDLSAKAFDLVVNVPGPAHWIGDEHRFWYAKSVKGGNEYLLVDADAATKKPAFDEQKLATAISTTTGQNFTALTPRNETARRHPRKDLAPQVHRQRPVHRVRPARFALYLQAFGLHLRQIRPHSEARRMGPRVRARRSRRSQSRSRYRGKRGRSRQWPRLPPPFSAGRR
jgi:hypothetical protein